MIASMALLIACLAEAQSEAPEARRADNPAEILRAIRTAYMANRTALAYGEIRFEVVTRRSNGDMPAGTASADVVGQGFYAFDGAYSRYELTYPPETMRKNQVINANEVTSFVDSQRMLTDGQVTLWDRITPGTNADDAMHTVQINPGTEIFYKYTQMIIEVGEPDSCKGKFLRLIDGALNENKYTLKKLTFSDHGRTNEASMEFDSPKLHAVCLIDLDHGAIPRRISIKTSDGLESVEEYQEIRQVADKAWLPNKWTLNAPGGFLRVFKITGSEFVRKPKPAAFQLDFTQAIPLINAAKGLKYAPRKSWDLHQLPPPSSPDSIKLQLERPGMPVPIAAGAPDARYRWWITPLVISAVTILAVGLLLLRRRP